MFARIAPSAPSHEAVIPQPFTPTRAQPARPGSQLVGIKVSVDEGTEPLPPDRGVKAASQLSDEELLLLLDEDSVLKRGNLTVDSVLLALFLVGAEPEHEQVSALARSLEDGRSEALVNVRRLLDECNVAAVELSEGVRFFSEHRRCARPDGFMLLPIGKYVILRFVALLVPFAAWGTTHVFFPQYTASEKAIYGLSKTVLGFLSTLMSVLVIINLVLVLSGSAKAITVAEMGVL
jgi:hypothetical protein